MRLIRFLIPAAAAVILGGVVIAVVINQSSPRRASTSQSQPSSDYADLVALKNQAESLAIEGKLSAAHAAYREFFAKAQGRSLKDPVAWDMLDRAKYGQDRVFMMLMEQQDGATKPTSQATPATATTQLPATSPSTTRSFVDTHPPHAATAPSTAPAPTTMLPATTHSNPLATTMPALPKAAHLKITRTYPDAMNFSDVLVGQSLAQGSEFLLAQLKDGEIEQGKDISESYRQGLNALVVYALLSTGQATRDPRLAITSDSMKKIIERMKQHPLNTNRDQPQQPIVYARSLRSAALAIYNRPEDQAVLKDDVNWLINAAVDGAYTYDDRYSLKVIPADPKDIPRQKPDKTKPFPWEQDPTKPKKLIPDPPAGLAPPSDSDANVLATQDFSPYCAAPDAIQLADGLHDPKTGAELGPYPMIRKYPRPPNTAIGPPQMLPDKYDGPFIWDNSNSQYGVMGVWAGAENGIEVPDAYWAAVQKHWMTCQLATGEWPYRKDRPGGYLAMTCAGLASMMITHDYLEAPSVARSGHQPSPSDKAIAAGLAWIEAQDNAVTVTGPRTIYLGYNLYSLSRLGLTTGYKFFGEHDWYRQLSRKIVLSQWQNGSWGRSDQPTADTLIDTAYTLLFLSRGRHPIIMNKLRLDSPGNNRGEWNNRPRDLANLCRFTSRELERPVNWQIVSIDRKPEDWSDAPILYFASQSALKFSDADLAKLRAYVDAGGLLFSQADTNSESFNLYVNQLAKKLFPNFESKDIPSDDELYSLQYNIAKNTRPRLRGVHNGARYLWIHSPTDQAVAWQQRAEKTQRPAFELAVNLFIYAAGKTDLRNRLDNRVIPAPTTPPSQTVPFARLKYNGTWDAEPAAFARFARSLQWQTSLTIDPKPVDITALTAQEFPFAHLSGIAAYSPTDAQIKSLGAYVNAGGTLIVESVGAADSAFAASLQSQVLPRAFPGARFDSLDATHPMLRASFDAMDDVSPPRIRAYAQAKVGKNIPAIRMATVGKGRVIYLPFDLTSGLLGTNTYPIFGYEPGEADAILKNIILWTLENSAK